MTKKKNKKDFKPHEDCDLSVSEDEINEIYKNIEFFKKSAERFEVFYEQQEREREQRARKVRQAILKNKR